MTYSVIAECHNYLEFSPELNYDDISDVINEAVDLRNDLIYRINHVQDTKDSREQLKKEYQNITGILYDKSIDFIERLNSLF